MPSLVKEGERRVYAVDGMSWIICSEKAKAGHVVEYADRKVRLVEVAGELRFKPTRGE